MKAGKVRENSNLTAALLTVIVLFAVSVLLTAFGYMVYNFYYKEKGIMTADAPVSWSVVSVTDTASPDTGSIEAMHETDIELTQAIDRIASSYGASAVQVAIIKNGTVVAYYQYGSKDKAHNELVMTDTVFRAASLSKLVDAMTVMKLCEEGKMDLDGNIENYLGYKVRSKKYPDIIITPRMLMIHTSGLVDSDSFLKSRNRCSSVPLKKLLSQSSSFSKKPPGQAYIYSNFGVAVLAAAAEKKAGEPFYEYTEKELFKPLNITGSFLASRIEDSNSIACLYNTKGNPSYTVQRQLSEKCANELGQTHHIYQGNLTISATDYAKLLCVLLNNGKSEEGQQILSSESVDEILKIQYQSEGTSCCLCNYISKTIVKGRTMHYHTGSNYGMYASFAFDTSDSSGVVVLTSGAEAQKEPSGVYNICGDIIRKIYIS